MPRAQGTGITAFYDPTDSQDWSAYLETYNGSGQRLVYIERNGRAYLESELDPVRLQAYSLSIGDIARAVRMSNGDVGGRVLELAQHEYAVRGRGYIQSREDIAEIAVATNAAGTPVTLGDIARIYERQTLNRVIRENQQYQRMVSYEFRGPTRLGDRVKESVLAATLLPPGYAVEDARGWSWSTEEKQQIWGVLALAIALVFMVTAALFESVRQPFCVLLTVPMALIGVFLNWATLTSSLEGGQFAGQQFGPASQSVGAAGISHWTGIIALVAWLILGFIVPVGAGWPHLLLALGVLLLIRRVVTGPEAW